MNENTTRSAVMLRQHRPGDMGWIVSRHGALYAQDYGWDIGFEGLVAEIAAQFIKNHDAARERCWIAEVDGERAGSVCVVDGGGGTAKLRLLLVEPAARGLGVGRDLVSESIAFARATGYREITLWTQSMLVAARSLYAKAGFRLVESAPHTAFGASLIGETWTLRL